MKTCVAWVLMVAIVFGTVSCASSSASREKENSVMYGMIYDYENNPVKSVVITIDEKKIYESDVMGHFIIDKYDPGKHSIRIEKPGFESVEDVFEYDPMSILYYRMITATQLVEEAERAVDKYDYVLAIDYIDRALALEPFRYDALYLKAVVYLVTGDLENAGKTIIELEEQGYKGPYLEKLQLLIEQGAEK